MDIGMCRSLAVSSVLENGVGRDRVRMWGELRRE